MHHGIVILRQTPYEDELEDLRWYPSQRGNQRLVCAPGVVQLCALLGDFLQHSLELGDSGIVLRQFMINAGHIFFDFGDLGVARDIVRIQSVGEVGRGCGDVIGRIIGEFGR